MKTISPVEYRPTIRENGGGTNWGEPRRDPIGQSENFEKSQKRIRADEKAIWDYIRKRILKKICPLCQKKLTIAGPGTLRCYACNRSYAIKYWTNKEPFPPNYGCRKEKKAWKQRRSEL